MSNSLRLARLGPVLAAILVLTAACGSTADGDSAAGADQATSSEAKTALATAVKGQAGTPPTTATTPKSGVNLWVVSCGEQVPSCAKPVAAAEQAAELVGWKVNVCDGQLNPDGWGTCVRRAVSAKADVVIPVGIDCVSIRQPFEEAKKAGVTVVGGGGADCDAAGGPKLWASERLQLEGVSIQDYWTTSGAMAADYLIGATDGKAQVLQLKFTDPIWGPWLTQGFEKQLATCSGCKVVATLEVANNDLVSNTANGKFGTAIQQAATANSVYVPVGGWMPTGFAQAVKASGRANALTVATGFGDEANLELIRSSGGQTAVLGYATAWGGYGSVDTAIRVLNGEQPVVEGDGFQMIDADHNLPAVGQDYDGGVDFVSAYKKAWGVS
jgi:ribose transport system substrate-binding protein